MEGEGGWQLCTSYQGFYLEHLIFWLQNQWGPFYFIRSCDIKFPCNNSKLFLRYRPKTKVVYKSIAQRILDRKIKVKEMNFLCSLCVNVCRAVSAVRIRDYGISNKEAIPRFFYEFLQAILDDKLRKDQCIPYDMLYVTSP